MVPDAREGGSRPADGCDHTVRRKRDARRAALLALSFALGAHSADAFAEDTGMVLSFQGPEECGSAAMLQARIEGRASRLRIGTTEPNHVNVDVRANTTYTATVRISGPVENSERKLEAADCGELLDAVSLVIVVSLDSVDRPEDEDGAAAPLPDSPGVSGEATTTEDDEPGTGPEVTGSTPNQEPPGLVEPPEWEDDYEPPDIGSPLTFRSLVPDRFGAGAGVRAHLGPAPSAMFGPELTFELLYAPESIGSTRLAVAASRSWSGHVVREQGEADFTLDQLLIELCPVRFGQARWELRPCLTGAGGRVIARGSGTNEPQTATRPWGFFGASARVSGRPASFLELWTAIGIGAALVRDQYQFEPIVFHTVPQETVTGALGLSALFP